MTNDNQHILSARFRQALVYAAEAHQSQIRKGTEIPYISHLLGVAAIALENGCNEDQAIAALLHDAVEDQGGSERLIDIRQSFGPEVARIVNDCTDTDLEPKPPWKLRKEAYLAGLGKKPRNSLEVSLADKTHNAGAIVADLHKVGDAIWDRFNCTREQSLWYYRELSDAFGELCPGDGADRFDRIVTEMERLAS